MVTGLVLLLASGMGIVCGWQPMPDGDASYECIIQLEPELVSTLKGGGSIPLSVDVPDHVRPIKRVRIVVGSGMVPQQSLATNLKPLLGEESKQSRDGIVEAQYTYPNNSGDNRYASQAAVTETVLPSNDASSNAPNPFARSLQNGRQSVQDAASQATQDILPPDPGRSIADAVDRSGQQLGNQVRDVGETVNSNIRQLFGREPANEILPNQGAGQQDSQILPPGSSPPAGNSVRNVPADNGQSILPPGNNQSTSNQRGDRPLGVSSSSDWQSRGSTAPSTTSGDSPRMTNESVPGIDPSRFGNQNFNTTPGGARSQPSGGSPPAFTARNSSVIPQSERYPDSIPPPERDSFDIADSRSKTPAIGPPTESDPGFPEFTPTASSNSGLTSTATPTSQGQSSVPEIRRDMLNVPAGSELQSANGLPIAQQNPSATPPAGGQSTTSTTESNWSTQTQPQSAQPVAQAGADPAPTFLLLVSWVLLSGSGAGNAYLFWSYLDIRNKYRDVLYEASRKISGRHGRD